MATIGIDLNDIDKIAPKKKKKAASHPKGKAGEYALIKILDTHSGFKWIRIPNSGAQLGKSNRERVKQLHESQIEALLGDIFPPGNLTYRFICESKNYGSFAFDKFNSGKVPANLKNWLEQMQHDCITYLITGSKRIHIGFLFVKITNEGEWLIFNKKYLTDLIQIKTPENYKEFIQNPAKELEKVGYGNEWIWCKANEFIELNKQKLFI